MVYTCADVGTLRSRHVPGATGSMAPNEDTEDVRVGGFQEDKNGHCSPRSEREDVSVCE